MDTRYIPARPPVLAEAIRAAPAVFGAAAPLARDLLDAIDRVIEQEVSRLHAHIDDLYSVLDPDEDTPVALGPGPDADERERRLLHLLGYVLDKANFETLSHVQIEAAIRAGTSYGVRVRIDPTMVAHLALFVRGHGESEVARRDRYRPWRRVVTLEPVYRRLVVVTRLRGEVGVRLKLFRDIPVRDVEALMPHATVEMSWIDRVLVFGGGAGALGGLAPKLFVVITGGVVSFFSLLTAAAIGLGGLMLKSFLGYRRTKQRRTNQRTQHLYERNIANNAAVTHTLLRMIRREEVKEALLAYTLLASEHADTESDDAIDRQAEAWIRDTFCRRINFDAPDALETLDRLDLWTDRASRRVRPPAEALETLRRHWIDRRSESYHLDTEAARRPATPPGEPPVVSIDSQAGESGACGDTGGS